MRLSEMKHLLAQNGLRLTKSLGQNFLHDANQLRRILAAAELSRSDKVLEIGPGLGPLTELLLDTAGEVLAIEKDARLVALLNKSLSSSSPAMEKHEGIPAQSPGLRGTSYPGDRDEKCHGKVQRGGDAGGWEDGE